ncbi:MAG: glucosyl-3-phosphoglycerate synthase [Anaerolineae bacterium]
MNNSNQSYSIMLALSEIPNLEHWITLARRLLPPNGELHLRGLVKLPKTQSLSEGTGKAREWRDALDSFARDYGDVRDDTGVYVDHRPLARLITELPSLNIDLLLVQWNGVNTMTSGVTTDEILQHAPCDVVLVHGDLWMSEGPVLLSLRGGPNVSLGMHVAKTLANHDSVTVLHAADRNPVSPNLRLLMRSDPQIARAVTVSSDVAESLIREASAHRAVVMGATFNQMQAGSSSSSPLIQRVQERTQTPLVLVRAYHPESLDFHVPGSLILSEATLSQQVDRWFAENTFHHQEFADLEALLALKEKQGLTISLGLPALNEEASIGKVITTLKSTMMDKLPLLDEIIVIDSNSTDRTVEIAESLGVPVYRHPDILPEVGSNHGKGEALWKSLYVLKGDIIAWVDTDITNISPHFVYGLLGPLLKHTSVQYVKGFYQRPIKVGEQLQAYGGGRVTELVARPLLNLFYPELSGVVQPLSGEYAGRRSALEQVPFFSGYGVETGLLLDLLERFGLESIAQTDLEVRVHHNQPLVNLSKMSFAILQVFMDRLENRYGIRMIENINRSMKLIIHEPDRFALEINEIRDVERPPIASIEAYLNRFRSTAAAAVG